MRSARALPGFRGFGGSVRSRVAEVDRAPLSRRAIRRGGRRPDPSIAPIGMSAIERLKARVREPENADGGGSHASALMLAVFASRTRASAPVFAVPDAAAPAGRGSLFRGLLLHRGPALVDHRARLDRARGRREKKVSPCCSARRMRGGREGTATTTPTRSLENRVASTRRRVPGCVYRARGRSRTRTERGGA